MKKLILLLFIPFLSFGQSTNAITAGEFPFYEDCIKTKTNNDKTQCIANKIKMLIDENFDKNVINNYETHWIKYAKFVATAFAFYFWMGIFQCC